MNTISCHRKYPITTNFLDTMLEHSVEIQEGESKLDAYRRGLKELDQIAAELRKEADGITSAYHTIALPSALSGTIPIISKEKDKVEIDIDNSTSLEGLQDLKELAGKFGLISHYIQKFNELNNGRPTDFAEGLS